MNTAPKAPRNTKKRGNGEGTIFYSQRRNRWVVACYDYKGIRRTESFKKKIEAESWNCLYKPSLNLCPKRE